MRPADERTSRVNKPHICWFLTGNEGGGVRSAVLNLLCAVRDIAGWPVSALTVAEGDMTASLRDHAVPVGVMGLEVPPQFSGPLSKQLRAVLSTPSRSRLFARTAEHCLPAGCPDIIHAQHPVTVHSAGAVARRIGAHVVWEMPNVISNRAMGFNRLFYQMTCWHYGIKVLSNSAYTGETFGNWPCKALTFHLGVDANRFDPARITAVTRDELGVPYDVPLFVLAARVVPEKGQLRFSKALLEASQDAHLVLLGGPTDTPEAQAVREVATSDLSGGRLRFIGPVPDPERYILAADVAVNARIDPEPFGLSIIEAMMLGKPVLPMHLVVPTRRCWTVRPDGLFSTRVTRVS